MKRSDWDIIAQIIRVAEKGAYKTHIMYRINLSWDQLKRYIKHMIEKNLIEAVDTNRKSPGAPKRGFRVVYLSTSKGRKFLKLYQAIKDLLEEEEPPIWIVENVQNIVP